MPHERLPPQLMALSAAGGAFVGSVVAVAVIWIFVGPICCDHLGDSLTSKQPAAAVVTPAETGMSGKKTPVRT